MNNLTTEELQDKLKRSRKTFKKQIRELEREIVKLKKQNRTLMKKIREGGTKIEEL